jgi:ribokinase
MGKASGGVLCTGNLVCDIAVRPADRFEWETTTWVEQISQSLGGNGALTSYAIARLGGRARLAGQAGRDRLGDFVLAILAEAGVDVSLVERSDLPTSATVALVHSSGSRALLHCPGTSEVVFAEPAEFAPCFVDGCTHFHLANIFGLPAMRPVAPAWLARARQAGLTTSLDTGWDSRGEWLATAGPCLEHVDLLFVNRDEASRLSGCEQPGEAARFLLAQGAGTVIVKLGEGGCRMFTPSAEFHSAGYEVAVVDTTGAGDCFAGAFLAARCEGAPLEEAAELANAVGALNVQGLGGTAGLRSREETLAWMGSARRRAIL